LIESELFGIEARVATGVDRRLGIFERTDGGTLFLDEIGDMPLDLQAKLLRVLQDREFTRIGGSDLIRVDVRLIAATNQDLQGLIEDRKFREDLFFRIHMLPIHLPPLRDRKVDVPLLANHFLLKFCDENGLPVPRMSASFTATLLRSQWPGNVRELQNYIERSVVMSPGTVLEPVVQPSDLDTRRVPRPSPAKAPHETEGQVSTDLKTASRENERTLILRALEDASGNQRRAAAILGVPEPTLRYRMRRLGISRSAASPARRGTS
jgi:transcriptional regulator with GAF, ATPase, and Fis domain